MDRKQAAMIIEETFTSPFDEGRFTHFARNLLNSLDESEFTRQGQYICDSFKEHVKQYKRIGKYTDPGGAALDVLIVHLKKEKSLERSRTRQRNFVAWYLQKMNQKDAALVAFRTDDPDDWRFSYVRMEYGQDVKDGKVIPKKELTPARRYSFLVGKNEPSHTAQAQLLPVLLQDTANPTLKEIEDAFSVEKVTKEFYQDYRKLYEKITEALKDIIGNNEKVRADFETKSIVPETFSKKLLGQIVFLYFLQKKGWLGVGRDERGDYLPWGSGPKNFLRRLLNREYIKDFNNYFNHVLEPLFYEALAVPHSKNYYSTFDCRIPFLNGGLFEPLNDYNWQETDIGLPDELFSNDDRSEHGDKGTGVFDVFDRYNFTVREDEPLEKEVAVDPEMLGKVFENLLPENLRKGKGTYYTPREIVHYMCQESLINYLDTAVNGGMVKLAPGAPPQEKLFDPPDPEQMSLETPGQKVIVPKKDIETLIRMGEFTDEHDQTVLKKLQENEHYNGSYSKVKIPFSVKSNAPLIDKALAEIRVCDPAAGSGAFLVGMMHEVVKARCVLKKYVPYNAEMTSYDFKRQCIQENLYGVDIDPGAIEIAKLRLWLSLVVDEESFEDIRPLPNLSYRIMQGNSLIEEFHGISLDIRKKDDNGLFDSDEYYLDKMIETLHKKVIEHINERHTDEKDELKDDIEHHILEIFRFQISEQKKNYFADVDRLDSELEKLAERDREPHRQKRMTEISKIHGFNIEEAEAELKEMTHGHKARNFFPWRLYFADVFREKGGFDVVIANPPYVQIQKLITDEKDILEKQGFKTFLKTGDIYCLFYEKGLGSLRSGGALSFISSNKFFRAGYGAALRSYLNEKNELLTVIDFGELPVFDAGTDPCILLVANREPQKEKITAAIVKDVADILNVHETIQKTGFTIDRTNLSNNGWTFESTETLALIKKIHTSGEPLDKYVRGRFYYGIKTGLNEAFVIDRATRDRLIAEDQKSAEVIKPWLRGKDIRRWYANYCDLYVINIYCSNNYQWPWSGRKSEMAESIFKKEYPAIYNHLEPFRIKLIARDDQGQYFWELRSCAYYEEFERPKIIYADIAKLMRASFDIDSMFCANTMYIVPTDNVFLLGYLNSSLFDWYARNTFQCFGDPWKGGRLRFIAQYMEKAPVPNTTKNQQLEIKSLVGKIISLKKENSEADVSYFEAEIDQMVYEMYGLTDEEIRIVEERSGK